MRVLLLLRGSAGCGKSTWIEKNELKPYTLSPDTTRRMIMKILKGKEQDYKDWYNKNSDPYGHACFTYAERWAEMLENAIDNSPDESMKVILDNADRLSREADTEGITGFMYGAAVSILSQCWKYGEELRKWHNKEYNYEGDGVVNPAVLAIG